MSEPVQHVLVTCREEPIYSPSLYALCDKPFTKDRDRLPILHTVTCPKCLEILDREKLVKLILE